MVSLVVQTVSVIVPEVGPMLHDTSPILGGGIDLALGPLAIGGLCAWLSARLHVVRAPERPNAVKRKRAE